MHRKQAAFTLVELLVVITIIGMLVALLVPAVISARERARQGVCVQRLREMALATLHYESQRGQLPGWKNRAPVGGAEISWVVTLFPYLDRDDLWKDWRDGSGTPAVFEQVVCPSDMGNLANPSPTNYVANRNLFRDRTNLSNLAANTVTLERLQSAQRTVLISERAHNSARPVGPWSGTSDIDHLTLEWPTSATTVYALREQKSGISSNHSAVVIVAFADGHVEAVAEDATTDAFFR